MGYRQVHSLFPRRLLLSRSPSVLNKASVTDAERLEKKGRYVSCTNKHNPARTGTEQPGSCAREC
jgi:hypothetical protein